MSQASPSVTPDLPPAPTAASIRAALARALRKDGFSEVCTDAPDEGDETSQETGVAAFLACILTLIAFAIYQRDPDVGGAIVIALAVFGAVLVVALLTRGSPALGAGAILLGAVATGLVQLFGPGFDAFALTHLMPVAAVTSGYWVLRGRRLAAAARGIPLLFPVALIVILIPLFSADLWQAADDLNAELIGAVAVLSITPVLLMLRKQLHDSVEAVFLNRAREIERSPESSERTLELVKDVVGKPEVFVIERSPMLGFIRKSLSPEAPTDYAATTSSLASPTFKKQITKRLVPLVLAVVTIMSLYIYALAWAALPTSTTGEWLDGEIPTETLQILDWQIVFPVGPYLLASALLGVVATAVFLAFVLTEERYSDALADALVHEPVTDCLLLAVPYLWFGEHEVEVDAKAP